VRRGHLRAKLAAFKRGPRFDDAGVVMGALRADIGGEASDVVRAHGFGPVSYLPLESVDGELHSVAFTARRAFELLGELRHGQRRWRVNQRVDMVVGDANGNGIGTNFASLGPKKCGQPFVDRGHEDRRAVTCRPDEVYEHVRRGVRS
jgi:hypothetical protein